MLALLLAIAVASLARTTPAGVPLPHGWRLREHDAFGTHGTIRTYAALHARYCETKPERCRLTAASPGWGQETLVPFEQAIRFANDHLEIQARGQPDGSITSGALISRRSWRSGCVEARYQIPATPGAWPSFWWFGAGPHASTSEIDVEQPIVIPPEPTGYLTVATIELQNHPTQGIVTPVAGGFHADLMALFTTTDYSAAPHRYTTCYDDAQGEMRRYIDGALIYIARDWHWVGPLPHAIVSLSAGGVPGWSGIVTDPSAFDATLAVYSLDYYAPRASAAARRGARAGRAERSE
jgi:hypothetical protein